MAEFYTIGHSNRPLEEFIRLLREAGVDLVVDLLAAGEAVTHIMGEGKLEPAQLTEAAVIGRDSVITYPSPQGHLLL